MKITIKCDCGEKWELDSSDIYVRDKTPCSCGQCRGEKFEVSLGSCPKCKKEVEFDA